ncbi:MAG: nucleotidyltransferase domain-containing protein [Deltaproteobacteria bacterium]|nr:nucleotidyltransferase domain-containing protein [Deltaproteobacteria bacterium]
MLPAHLTPAERAALKEFLSEARAALGADLIEARLFGSRARGEGTAESDVDVALVVTWADRGRRHALYDLAFDVGLRHGVSLAPLVLEQDRLEELRSRERLLAHDLDREGIPI